MLPKIRQIWYTTPDLIFESRPWSVVIFQVENENFCKHTNEGK